MTLSVAETIAGKPNVLHLDLQPGTDIALFNGLFTYVVEQGWHDKDFIAKRTNGFDAAVSANKLSLEECSRITGVSVDKLRQAAEWAYKPKANGARPRAMHAYEKGIIWGNDNYLIQSALLDLAIATYNVGGRRGTGCIRMGGHQEGYTRPPHPTGEKIYVDQELIKGNGRMMTWWACNNFQTSNNAHQLRDVVLKRSQIVKEAMAKARGATSEQMVDVIYDATTKGGLFVASINLYPTMLADAAHLMLPSAHPGEMNLTSMNGERRMRLSREVHGPSRRCQAGLHHRCDDREQDPCAVSGTGKHRDGAALRRLRLEDRGRRVQRRIPAGRPPRRTPIDSQGDDTGYLATYELLRAAGNNGVQLPIKEIKDGKMVGTTMLYTEKVRHQGRQGAIQSHRPGLACPRLWEAQKAKHKYWINNGRNNEIWQTGYHNQYDRTSAIAIRWPTSRSIPTTESRRRRGGDVIEVWNDYRLDLRDGLSGEGRKAWPDVHGVRPDQGDWR